jgi:hypothetical protein
MYMMTEFPRNLCEIWDFHSGEVEECRLLGRGVVQILCEPTSRLHLQGRTICSHCSHWFLVRWFFYPKDGGDTFLRNVGSPKIYTAPHLRRRHFFLEMRCVTVNVKHVDTQTSWCVPLVFRTSNKWNVTCVSVCQWNFCYSLTSYRRLAQNLKAFRLDRNPRFRKSDGSISMNVRVAFWIMTPYNLVACYQRFEGMYCLHLRGRRLGGTVSVSTC